MRTNQQIGEPTVNVIYVIKQRWNLEKNLTTKNKKKIVNFLLWSHYHMHLITLKHKTPNWKGTIKKLKDK